MISDAAIIPRMFEKYEEEIKATVRESIGFKLKKASNLKICHSKVGGIPYLPVGEEYPRNSKGSPLTFLMQINFSEIPPLPDYPTEGVVSFYIDEKDDLLGLDFNRPTKQDGFRVLYFPTIEPDESKLQQNLANIENTNENYESNFPFHKSFTANMEFHHEMQYITPLDYRFDNCISFVEDYDLVDKYDDIFGKSVHRIGGYPHFAQEDPRSNHEEFQDYELLVQLCSDENEIGWGMMGVGAFFIHPNDLKECNFSKVLYNWDSC
ncbi:hypothetical protein WA026_016357 [Henosepilachna vigintioctopunctata]|uniref:DUF1963 domain-containing protein n=1 Tax=Henosepilachna vigintioctopunctata TaxID=420089 RepID=A0AAW1UJQ1_9CUCU